MNANAKKATAAGTTQTDAWLANYPELARQAQQAIRLVNHRMADQRNGLIPQELCEFLGEIEQLLGSLSDALNRGGNGLVNGQLHHCIVDTAGDARTNAIHAREHMVNAAEQINRGRQLIKHAGENIEWQYVDNDETEKSAK